MQHWMRVSAARGAFAAAAEAAELLQQFSARPQALNKNVEVRRVLSIDFLMFLI